MGDSFSSPCRMPDPMIGRIARTICVAATLVAVVCGHLPEAHATKVGIGPSVGQVYSTMAGDVDSELAWRGGPVFGGKVRLEFPQVVGVETGVAYSLMGAALVGETRRRDRATLDFHKLSVPLLLQIRLAEFGLRPRLVGGGTLNFVGIACLDETCRNDPFEAAQFGWTAGFGIDVGLPAGGLTIEGRFEQTRLEASSAEALPAPFEASSYGLSGIVLEVGLLF